MMTAGPGPPHESKRHGIEQANPPDHHPAAVQHGQREGDLAVRQALLAAGRQALRRGEGRRSRAARRPRIADVLADLPAGSRPDADRGAWRGAAAGRGNDGGGHHQTDRQRPARHHAGGAGHRAQGVPAAEPGPGGGAAAGRCARDLHRVRRVRGRVQGPGHLRAGRRCHPHQPGPDRGQPEGGLHSRHRQHGRDRRRADPQHQCRLRRQRTGAGAAAVQDHLPDRHRWPAGCGRPGDRFDQPVRPNTTN